jgi:hypothetical protein
VSEARHHNLNKVTPIGVLSRHCDIGSVGFPVAVWIVALPAPGRLQLSPYGGMPMAGSRTEMALREMRNDLAEMGRRADRLDLELVASLIRMAIFDIEAALRDDGVPVRLDS